MWPETWLCAGMGALLAAAALFSSQNPGHVPLLSWPFLPCGVSEFAGSLRVLMASSLPGSPWCTWVLGWWSVPQVQCGILIRPLRESQISTASCKQASRRRLLRLLLLMKSILSTVSPICQVGVHSRAAVELGWAGSVGQHSHPLG